jgi:putative nucleotidyltransferase with HDIG domain
LYKWIGVRQLRRGMYVCEIDGSWIESPFWRKRFLLENDEDVRKLVATGINRIRIDISRGLDVSADAPDENAPLAEAETPAPIDLAATAPQRVSMDRELERAARICLAGKEAVNSMFREVRMGKAIDVHGMASMVEDISSSVTRNPGALVSLARLKTKNDYTYMHSVAVCALMVALARQMQLPDDQVRSAGLAGLLHDIGKATSPDDILNKPGKLTDTEFNVMRQHPVAGHALLLEAQGADDIALDVCLHHHEKIDGSGYPHKLRDKEISLFAKMGAVCDVYDAVTSERPYNKGWDPAETIRRMAEWSGHFDPVIFQLFVKSIGIYPVGSLVRLQSGRLAVVMEQNAQSLTTPRIKVFFSTKSRAQLPSEIIDLAKPGCTEKIIGRESPEKWGLVELERLWVGGV